MTQQSSQIVAWVAGFVALAVIGAWLTPSAMAGQALSGWLAGIATGVAALIFAASAARAWPKSERLVSHLATSVREGPMEKNRNTNPLVETGEEADRRAHELPEQPQEHIIRGYGAVNPEEGALEQKGEQ